jgi:hypothetical protein
VKYYGVCIMVEARRFNYNVQAPSRDLAILYAAFMHAAEQGEPEPGSKVTVSVN